MTGVRDYSTAQLKHNVVALAEGSESAEAADSSSPHQPRQHVGADLP